MNDDDVMEIHDLLVMSLIFDENSQISFSICNVYVVNLFMIFCIKHILFFIFAQQVKNLQFVFFQVYV